MHSYASILQTVLKPLAALSEEAGKFKVLWLNSAGEDRLAEEPGHRVLTPISFRKRESCRKKVLDCSLYTAGV